MVLLSAYLTVFDWNLIWLIEYGDLTKLLLIGVALIASVATTLIYQAQDVYLWVVKQSAQWKKIVIGGVLLTLIINGYIIYHDAKTGNHLETYHVFRAASFYLFLFLIYSTFKDYQGWLKGHWITISNQIAFLTIFLATVGAAYAYYIKDVSTHTREIWTKDEKFLNAKIVMFLSHHVAFVVDQRIVVVPTTEVTRIVSQPTSK
jgi:hypothetical protein